MTSILRLAVFASALATFQIEAQNAVQEFRADLLTGGVSAAGRVIVAGDQLVFVSDTNPGDSFFVPRSNIQSMTSDRETLTVQLREAMRDRTGERLRLTFRMMNERASAAAGAWHSDSASNGAQAAASSPAGAAASEARTYQARHKKRFGGSRGRLIITNAGLAYEAIDNASASRRWDFNEIRELKLKNPYELEIVPSGDDRYTLELEGQGMDRADYNRLVDTITKARAVR